MAIEIHDAGLSVSDAGLAGGGQASTRPAGSPGFALVDGEAVVTGSAARQALRLTPKRVSSRFWSELDTAPLPRPFPEDLSHADLAHAHLSELWREAGPSAGAVGEVLLAVPGSFSAGQLGLLLGIARACAMPVTGLVDAAVAAAAAPGPAGARRGGRLLHVDLELHRAVITELQVAGPEVSRQAVEVVSGIGLQRLHDIWLRHVAGLFVRRTRFDPLHTAACEQALDSRLQQALAEIVDQEAVDLEAETGGRSVSIEVGAGELTAAVAGEYRTLADAVARRAGGGAMALLLSHRAAGLPGLASLVAESAGSGPARLSPGAAGRGALAAAASIRHGGEALPLVTRLPVAP